MVKIPPSCLQVATLLAPKLKPKFSYLSFIGQDVESESLFSLVITNITKKKPIALRVLVDHHTEVEILFLFD